MQGAAEQGGMKPQLTSAVYAETSMNHKPTSNSEYAVIAHNTASAKGHSLQGPSRQANSTGAPGTSTGVTALEYATVQDALPTKKDAPRSQTPLANTPICHHFHLLPHFPAHRLGLACSQTVFRMPVMPHYQTVKDQIGSPKCAV